MPLTIHHFLIHALAYESFSLHAIHGGCLQKRLVSATHECADAVQVQRQVLRNLLSAVLQEDRQQLEHYQLTVEVIVAWQQLLDVH
jgi:hypothetical protein